MTILSEQTDAFHKTYEANKARRYECGCIEAVGIKIHYCPEHRPKRGGLGKRRRA